jgi:hypothetical protein
MPNKWLLAVFIALILGIAASPLIEAIFNYMYPPPAYSRDCLPGDTCTMIIKPAGAPWLNIVCDLSTPPRCRDGEPSL